MGPLSPVRDDTTGIPLLLLPDGFSYLTMSWAGQKLHDGFYVPGNCDGMGVVRQDGHRVSLVRNHELTGSAGPLGDPLRAYDVTGGGTTTLVFDTEHRVLLDSWVSLGGTLNNCAGGVTPWNTWLSCEESFLPAATNQRPVSDRQRHWRTDHAEKPHGYVFEVPASGIADPQPIAAMGQFYHEAVAVDPDSGIAYMTEDNAPHAGFYRFKPTQPGKLNGGGRLQMMRVESGKDMRDGLPLRQEFDIDWVDIPEPEPRLTHGGDLATGVVRQGLASGGSSFVGLEGCIYDEQRVYFTSKTGGSAGAGYIFEHDVAAQTIRLVYESAGHTQLSGPDNITVSPRGSLLVCEDRVTSNKAAQQLAGLTRSGEMFRFCQVNPALRGLYAGHDLSTSVLMAEWAGATFSRDGDWLFCNLYSPGATVAITGPWQQGLI